MKRLTNHLLRRRRGHPYPIWHTNRDSVPLDIHVPGRRPPLTGPGLSEEIDSSDEELRIRHAGPIWER